MIIFSVDAMMIYIILIFLFLTLTYDAKFIFKNAGVLTLLNFPDEV